MNTQTLPSESTMVDAFFRKDASFDGIFVTAVRTTGIFCRPSCSARKPNRENISFFPTPADALQAGYRPCKRCEPMGGDRSDPDWLSDLLAEVDADPTRRWTDSDLRARGLSPERVRRWFQKHHGMTFHAYSRALRLGSALGWMQEGDGVTTAAFSSGYESLSGFNEAFRRYFGSNPTATAGSTRVQVDRVVTPLGPMLVGTSEDALHLLEFVDRRALQNQILRIRDRLDVAFVPGRNALLDQVARQLEEYFSGRRRSFDVRLAEAGSSFQHEVWEALRQIPYGETRSYAEVAEMLGRPSAVRAVGKANGDNALAIIVPCHRVVGADGRLVGYGGGLWRKQRLLDLERGQLALG
jgi:AraC family transcriptional regulator of adaptative response/methylated-DNA-[protein]-cysteine methyltransferase